MSQNAFHRFLIRDSIPFGDALPTFIKGYCNSYEEIREHLSSRNPPAYLSPKRINRYFFEYVSSLSNRYDPHFAFAPHGTFRVSGSEPPDRPSRFSLTFERLSRRAQLITQNLKKYRKNETKGTTDSPIWIYSPLYFSRILLTSPTFPASDALAHAVVRAYIFEEALRFEDVWAETLTWTSRQALTKEGHAEESAENAFLRIREIVRFDRVENTLQKLESFSNNRDSLPIKNATDFVVCHLLASRGLLMFRFDQPGIAIRSDDPRPGAAFSSFVAEATLVPSDGVYQFDKPKEVRRLPSASRVINELDGLPVAIPGASLVLEGGLRFTTQTGLVARLYGPAGIGKTSAALALCASLAPIGTETIYLSCEERSDDLLHRIRTLVPRFIKRTQSYRPPEDWFTAEYVSGDFQSKRDQILSFLQTTIDNYSDGLPKPDNSPPGLMPLLIVLDGVHEMFPSGEDSDAALTLRQLVERCQNTGALVLALSSESPRGDLAEFDYLVDLVAHLEYAKSKGEMDPSTRIFRLEKSRRQLSRSGAHILDLTTKEQGMRIVPQINAHLSENRTWAWVDPSAKYTVDFLLTRASFLPSGREALDEPLVRIRDRSQVLVTGRGSSGKSLFGLRLLASQFIGEHRLNEIRDQAKRDEHSLRLPMPRDRSAKVTQEDEWPWFEEPDPSRRRILVLSFLYQKEFYDDLKKVQRFWKEDSLLKHADLRIIVDTEHFSPGFLRPEALIDVVSERVDSAVLEGLPYHGVLIDGIHNVFLQFPHLEASDIVWPALFELLRTRGLAVVTTHTHFDVSEYGSVMQDLQASRRRVGPLLHALVQSSDYVIKLHPVASLRYDEGDFARAARATFALDTANPVLPQNEARRPPEPARFLIEVPGALSQDRVLPPLDWAWDKTRGIAYQPRIKRGQRNTRAGEV